MRLTRMGSRILGVVAPILTAGVCFGVEAPNFPAPAQPVPIHVPLVREGLTTVVIEDEAGNRVRNLIAETPLAAGDNLVYWDGYDDGSRNENGDLVRRRVPPGTYRLRGLTHGGVRMLYETTVDNPGSPPWATKDGSGGWLADHSPPADVLWLPQGVPAPNGKGTSRFLVCSTSAEAGSEFVWLDADGRRLYGTNDGFWGGTHLARDAGPHASPDYYAYVFESGQRDADNFNIEVRGFKTDGGGLESVLKFPRPHSLPTFKGDEAYGSDGLAVYNGRIVCAVTAINKLVFGDVKSHLVTGEVALPSPRAPAFDRDGSLLVISEGKVKRFRLPDGPTRLDDVQTLISDGLDDPRRLMVDERGSLFVSDWGRSHQVKVFDLHGKFLRTIGKPGGARTGTYDEQRMAHPCGAALDATGRLWVAEGDLPKRISLWEADGSFARAFYGPAKYGGGGALDRKDKSRFYYDEGGCGIEFAIDWKTGASKPKNIYWRPDSEKGTEIMPGPAPERANYAGGRQYLTNCFNGGLRFSNDRGAGIWRMDPDGAARPVAMIGNGADLVNGIWGWPMKHRDQITRLWSGAKTDDVLFVWSDRNGDGVGQPEEVQWVAEDHSASPQHDIGGLGLEPLVLPDLSIATAYGTHIPAPRIDERGVPFYDLAKREKVGDSNQLRSPLIAGDRVVTHQDADNSWLGSDLAGGRRWRYVSTPEEQIGGPGAMVQPTRLLGPAVTPAGGDAGPIVAINGEMGAVFLLTSDGLFVQTLGGDARLLPPLSEPDPKRGQVLDHFTFQQEHFHPTITQTEDGNVYLVAGFQQGTILRLDGLESVSRHDFGHVRVAEADLTALPPTSVQPSRREGRPQGRILEMMHGPKVDADLSNWPADAQWLRIDERASGSIAADSDNLYVAFRTGDPNALDNAGRDYRYLFKTGGALDLMLDTSPRDGEGAQHSAGELRLLVTQTGGKTAAVLYRPSLQSGPKAHSQVFESPIGKVEFDEVLDVSDHVMLAGKGGSYAFSIPLKALGFEPKKDMQFIGDIGILRGAEGRTIRRVYWSNINTTLVSDLPTEARLQPSEWGVLKVE